jgi:hypothetical protein
MFQPQEVAHVTHQIKGITNEKHTDWITQDPYTKETAV